MQSNPNADIIRETIRRWLKIVEQAEKEGRDVSVEDVEAVRRENERMESDILG